MENTTTLIEDAPIASDSPHRYFIINKPYNMLSQFKSTHEGDLLGGLAYNFPKGIHAVGRLDKTSEGLLILTTNKKVTRLLFQSEIQHKRTYLVKVKNTVTPEKLSQLQTGIKIRLAGGRYYTTAVCEALIIDKPAGLFERLQPPKEYGLYTWLLITLTEGRFRQIRKMVKAIHHRCERLIRVSIENLHISNLQVGEVREIEETQFFEQLKITNWQ